MAEEKPQGIIKSTVSGWVKAGITSVVGLASGAVLMYLTPLVNNVIKPGKPVANFAAQVTGLTVQFNNRSAAGTQGWWDFGDGSALEPYDPKVDTIKHTYPKTGTYQVKLSLKNLINEENERVVPVTLEAASIPTPEITLFQLVPLTSGERAPAVYRLLTKVKNAQFCILSVGDEKPLEIIDDANQDRYVTFNEMGVYSVRLAAVNGKQLVEQVKTVYISPNEGVAPMAKLLVTYEAVKVERLTRDWRIHCDWQGGPKDSVSAIRKERPATQGYSIASAQLVNKDDVKGAVRKAQVEIAPDKSKLILTGELTQATGLLSPKGPLPSWLAEVRVVMEKRSAPQLVNRGEVAMAVDLNTTITLPIQSLEEGWEIIKKNVSLELWDGNRKVWESSKPVVQAKVMLKNQTSLVTMSPQQDGVVLKIEAATTGVVPASAPARPQVGPVIRQTSFERNPLAPILPMNK